MITFILGIAGLYLAIRNFRKLAYKAATLIGWTPPYRPTPHFEIADIEMRKQ